MHVGLPGGQAGQATPVSPAPAKAEAADGEAIAAAPANPSPSEPKPEASPPPAPSPGPVAFDPVQAGDGRLPVSPLSEIDEDVGTMLNHIQEFGWNSDGSAFLYCFDNGGPGDCHHVPVSGKPRQMMGGTRRWSKLVKANRPLAKGAKTWPYPDVTITWAQKKHKLLIGGRVGKLSGKPDIHVIKFDREFAEAMVYPEVVSVSPDGTHVIIVGHAAWGEALEEVAHRLITTASFAANAYSSAGFEHLRKEKFEDAARWFQRATDVGSAWKHPFNLACARARGSLPRRRGGAAPGHRTRWRYGPRQGPRRQGSRQRPVRVLVHRARRLGRRSRAVSRSRSRSAVLFEPERRHPQPSSLSP